MGMTLERATRECGVRLMVKCQQNSCARSLVGTFRFPRLTIQFKTTGQAGDRIE